MPDLEVHLLDPGAIEYGDSVLCLANGKSILIDGGKKASARETRDTVLGREVVHDPIQQQIEALNGSTAVDLLIVTHCHSDHVGSLPALFQDGTLSCQWALIADPQLGFGIGGDLGPIPPPDKMSAAEKLWMALREEPVHSANDDAVREFIEDAAGEYREYVALVEFLERTLGPRCVRFKGADALLDPFRMLLAEFSGAGLQILGPSHKQLGNCAKFLVGRNEDIAGIEGQLAKEGRIDLAAAYRDALRTTARADAGEAEEIDDTPDNGNAVNNQSIVLTIGEGAGRALLGGDMQFARPQMGDAGVNQEMDLLRRRIADDVARNGPFGFVKLSHHGAGNGQNLALLREWGAGLFGISTGSASSKHPTAAVLTALEQIKGENRNLRWGRTDLNGRITYKAAGARPALLKQRGRWNDSTLPAQRAGDAGPAEAPSGQPSAGAAVAPSPALEIPSSQSVVRTADGTVEVTIKLPYGKGKVRVTVETDAEGPAAPLS